MKISILFCALLITMTLPSTAGTPEQEKAFTDKYKTAFEGKDTATLESFLYTQGADPSILGFYKMMQSAEAGEKISNIQLVNLTPEDVKKAATAIPWAKIVGMRHVLVHDYFGIDRDVVWNAVERELPRLAPELRALLNDLESRA